LRLQALAQLQASQGKYSEASATYDRASDILDTMIGNVTSEAGKIGLISSMSAVYAEHFALAADHLKDTAKAFSVLEHARMIPRTSCLLLSARVSKAPFLAISRHSKRRVHRNHKQENSSRLS
jgi:hypothetical protein